MGSTLHNDNVIYSLTGHASDRRGKSTRSMITALQAFGLPSGTRLARNP
jgi:hypothetical protein